MSDSTRIFNIIAALQNCWLAHPNLTLIELLDYVVGFGDVNEMTDQQWYWLFKQNT